MKFLKVAQWQNCNGIGLRYFCLMALCRFELFQFLKKRVHVCIIDFEVSLHNRFTNNGNEVCKIDSEHQWIDFPLWMWRPYQWRIQGGAPLRTKIFLFSCSFWENLCIGAFPWRVGAPSYGESLIRPCRITNCMNDSFECMELFAWITLLCIQLLYSSKMVMGSSTL